MRLTAWRIRSKWKVKYVLWAMLSDFSGGVVFFVYIEWENVGGARICKVNNELKNKRTNRKNR